MKKLGTDGYVPSLVECLVKDDGHALPYDEA